MPGVVDRIRPIEALNLAREWDGKRPTVILMAPLEMPSGKIDQAMKILVKDGRLVSIGRSTPIMKAGLSYNPLASEGDSPYLWGEIGKKYRHKMMDHGDVNTNALSMHLVDKTPPDPSMPSTPPNIISDKDVAKFYDQIEDLRKERVKLTPDLLDFDHPGILSDEQTFDQPISNPWIPEHLRQPQQAPVNQPTTQAAPTAGPRPRSWAGTGRRSTD